MSKLQRVDAVDICEYCEDLGPRGGELYCDDKDVATLEHQSDRMLTMLKRWAYWKEALPEERENIAILVKDTDSLIKEVGANNE